MFSRHGYLFRYTTLLPEYRNGQQKNRLDEERVVACAAKRARSIYLFFLSNLKQIHLLHSSDEYARNEMCSSSRPTSISDATRYQFGVYTVRFYYGKEKPAATRRLARFVFQVFLLPDIGM